MFNLVKKTPASIVILRCAFRKFRHEIICHDEIEFPLKHSLIFYLCFFHINLKNEKYGNYYIQMREESKPSNAAWKATHNLKIIKSIKTTVSPSLYWYQLQQKSNEYLLINIKINFTIIIQKKNDRQLKKTYEPSNFPICAVLWTSTVEYSVQSVHTQSKRKRKQGCRAFGHQTSWSDGLHTAYFFNVKI